MPAYRSACHRNNFSRACAAHAGRVGEDPREEVGVGVGVVECELYFIRYYLSCCRSDRDSSTVNIFLHYSATTIFAWVSRFTVIFAGWSNFITAIFMRYSSFHSNRRRHLLIISHLCDAAPTRTRTGFRLFTARRNDNSGDNLRFRENEFKSQWGQGHSLWKRSLSHVASEMCCCRPEWVCTSIGLHKFLVHNVTPFCRICCLSVWLVKRLVLRGAAVPNERFRRRVLSITAGGRRIFPGEFQFPSTSFGVVYRVKHRRTARYVRRRTAAHRSCAGRRTDGRQMGDTPRRRKLW